MVTIVLGKRFLVLFGIFLLVLLVMGLVFSYNSQLNFNRDASVMGHSLDEINWTSGTIPLMRVNNLFITNQISSPKYCIGQNCITSWPSAGAALPTCANNQVLKYNASTSSWVCANDIDTNAQTLCPDNKFLDGSGACKSAAEIVSAGSAGVQKYDIACQAVCNDCQSSCAEGFALTSWRCSPNAGCYILSDGRTGYVVVYSSSCSRPSGSGTCSKI